MQRVVRTAEKIIMTSLPSIKDIAQKHCKTKAYNIIRESVCPSAIWHEVSGHSEQNNQTQQKLLSRLDS